MDILVLGATGYIGSNVARQLQAAGHRVTGLSRSDAGDAKLDRLGVRPLRGDLDQMDAVLARVTEFDAVVYVAQLMLDAERLIVGALLDQLAGRGKGFVFTSGTGLLSERTDGDWSENTFAEHDPFVPSKYIGARKQTEDLVRAAGEAGRVRAMVIRPPLIWGHGGCAHVRQFYQSGLATGAVCYVGAGLNLYSNVHVDDLAEVYRLVLEQGTPGALYHAVAGEVANRTIAEAVASQLGLPTRSVGFAEAEALWGRFTTLVGMSTCSRSRSPRTRRELGWTPRHLDFLADVGDPAYLETARAALRA